MDHVRTKHPRGAAPTSLSNRLKDYEFSRLSGRRPGGLDFSFSARTPTEPGVADIADGRAVGRKSPSFWSASGIRVMSPFSARTPTEPGVADIADGRTVGRKSPSFTGYELIFGDDFHGTGRGPYSQRSFRCLRVRLRRVEFLPIISYAPQYLSITVSSVHDLEANTTPLL